MGAGLLWHLPMADTNALPELGSDNLRSFLSLVLGPTGHMSM